MEIEHLHDFEKVLEMEGFAGEEERKERKKKWGRRR